MQKERADFKKTMGDFVSKIGITMEDYEAEIYHVFKVRIGGKFYRDSRIFTDEEFERVMGLVGWQMPFNLSAYHFHSEKYPPNSAIR